MTNYEIALLSKISNGLEKGQRRKRQDMNAKDRLDAMRTGPMQGMAWHIDEGVPDMKDLKAGWPTDRDSYDL